LRTAPIDPISLFPCFTFLPVLYSPLIRFFRSFRFLRRTADVFASISVKDVEAGGLGDDSVAETSVEALNPVYAFGDEAQLMRGLLGVKACLLTISARFQSGRSGILNLVDGVALFYDVY